VHCPRCGSPNEPGDKFCAACGEALGRSGKQPEPGSARNSLRALIGSDRKTRTITAATVLAIVVAVVAFIALSPDEDSIPRDGYTLSAERICLKAKGQIVSAANQGDGSFAAKLVPIVVRWREQLAELTTPADRTQQVGDLEDSLREMEIEAADLARTSATGSRGQILAEARRAEAASAEVEAAVAALGLSECAAATIEFKPVG
jgi:hypothetical protein